MVLVDGREEGVIQIEVKQFGSNRHVHLAACEFKALFDEILFAVEQQIVPLAKL